MVHLLSLASVANWTALRSSFYLSLLTRVDFVSSLAELVNSSGLPHRQKNLKKTHHGAPSTGLPLLSCHSAMGTSFFFLLFIIQNMFQERVPNKAHLTDAMSSFSMEWTRQFCRLSERQQMEPERARKCWWNEEKTTSWCQVLASSFIPSTCSTSRHLFICQQEIWSICWEDITL